ncbi:MAG: DNA repair protein RecO [Planctomycetota bacterium]|jgi:DNA repair protein RecO (recombination protein O)
MPTVTDNAICIRRWDFSETSQTVSLFVRSHGIVRGMVKGAKRARGGFEGGIDLLTHGQVVAIIKPARDLATVTQWRVLDPFRALREHLGANRAGLYMADLIHHMLTEHDPHPGLFDALCSALDGLGNAAEIDRALVRFEWQVLVETGFRPQLARDAETGAALPPSTATLGFSAAAGGVVADTGSPDRWRVRRDTIDLLRAVAAGEPGRDADGTRHGRAARLLAVYIREILGAEPRSMRWAFPDLRI